MNQHARRRDAAMAGVWAARSADPAFDDWDAFTDWLEQDSARSRAYDDAALALAEAPAVAVPASVPAADNVVYLPLPPTPEERPRPRRWPALVAGGVTALAASLLAVVAMRDAPAAPDAVTTIAAAAGTTRTVALPDGSRIVLAGGSTVRLSGARTAELASGSAMFVVRHDAAHPFRVRAGPHDIVDVGTAFEVARTGADVRVAVAEGRVIVDPAGTPLSLTPGAAVRLHGGRRTVSRLDPGSVGQWRNDRMSYRDASLRQVAGDLSAATGRGIDVAPDAAAGRFTGTLVPAALRDRPAEVAALLDVAVRVDEGRWTLHRR